MNSPPGIQQMTDKHCIAKCFKFYIVSHRMLELYYKLYPKLSKKQQYFHDEILCRVSTVISEMEYNGIHIDKHIAERYYLIYGTIQRRLYDKFIQDERIPQTLKYNTLRCAELFGLNS